MIEYHSEIRILQDATTYLVYANKQAIVLVPTKCNGKIDRVIAALKNDWLLQVADAFI